MEEDEKNFELRKIELEHKFQAAKLDKEQALQKEIIDKQRVFEAGKEYARQVSAAVLQYDAHLKEYGQLALRSVFLLNGGAILALLTLIGSSIGKSVGTTPILPSAFVSAFLFFAAGLLSCVGSMTFAYLNYTGHRSVGAGPGDLANNMIAQQPKWPGNYQSGKLRLISWSWKIALVLGISSLALFCGGCLEVAAVFSKL